MSNGTGGSTGDTNTGAAGGSVPATVPPSTEAELKNVVEIWKQIISVQMHFNDIEMRIRNLYVTVLLGVVAATGWVVEKKLRLHLAEVSVHYAVAVLAAGAVSSYLFYFIDRYWYHQLLKGSVEQGRLLDQHYGASIPALGLTSQISGASPIFAFRRTMIGRAFALLRVISAPQAGEGQYDLHSTGKIELFYKTPIRILWLFGLLALLFGGVTFRGRSLCQALTGSPEAPAAPAHL
jgi:hypothetical protein